MFNKSEIEFLVNAIDTHVRKNGIRVAQAAVGATAKLQHMAQSAPDAAPPQATVIPTAGNAESVTPQAE